MSLSPAAVDRDPARFVSPAEAFEPDPLLRFSLRPADRPLVVLGQPVESGQPIIRRFRDQEAVEIATTAALVGLAPGTPLDDVPVGQAGRLGRRSQQGTYQTRVCEHGRDGITRLAAGSGEVITTSPASGVVTTLLPGRIDIQAHGLGVAARIGWGRPAAGRIVIAAARPDAEVPASRIDVSAAGAILVVGARLDVEAMSRARAIGVAAVISGGVASRDLRQLDSSEARQQAALHGTAPFGLLALAGYGRVPVQGYLWDLLVAAEGRPAGIHPGARRLVIGGDAQQLLAAVARPPGTVRVTCGEGRDREGRLVGLAGPRRWPGGIYAPGAFVEVPASDGSRERICVPLSTLERLG